MVIAVVHLVAAAGAAVFYGGILDRQPQGPQLRAAWADGLTAEARCTSLRTEEAQDSEGARVVHTHPTPEFRTADGRTVRSSDKQSST
ncbi:hypothetical protein ACFVYE_38335 [Streptomyces sp. NPDC058239]|uniref:hypothetical protein n=1 Tax=unclassified Streptomyces TaxID=2593676 RepID=UPI003652905B